MKTFFYNIGYFLLEAVRTIRFNLLTNLFSVLGTSLILFLFGLVAVGWSVGDQIIATLAKEAEVSAYFIDGMEKEKALLLRDKVMGLEGILEARYIEENEARAQMEDMLGEEAKILELFEENPFDAYLEVRIDLEVMDKVISEVNNLEGIDYVRDNREVLNQMKEITEGMKLLGTLIIIAVGITTIIIISHMIRQGIYNNREQIHTLRLLGAPESFIGLPFVLTGLLLTLFGGILAAVSITYLLQGGYSQLGGVIPFIPLPSSELLQLTISRLIIVVSGVLGLLGSMFGLSSIKNTQ
jgi:cell division transport system permease protein